MPKLYIIAGCNGAGKTTASFTVLPEILDCREFINADEIARGLSPLQPEKVAFQAGRIMLTRMDDLLRDGVNFAVETTLASKIYVKFIQRAKELGYETVLVFFWLNSVELAKQRVRIRVIEGGHNIPWEVIERRYDRGLNNFFGLYKVLVDRWSFIDNSGNEYRTIAFSINRVEQVLKQKIWDEIKRKYRNK